MDDIEYMFGVPQDKAKSNFCPFSGKECQGRWCMLWVWYDDKNGGCGMMQKQNNDAKEAQQWKQVFERSLDDNKFLEEEKQKLERKIVWLIDELMDVYNNPFSAKSIERYALTRYGWQKMADKAIADK